MTSRRFSWRLVFVACAAAGLVGSQTVSSGGPLSLTGSETGFGHTASNAANPRPISFPATGSAPGERAGALAAGPSSQESQEPPVIPPVWDIVADDFESGSLSGWGVTGDVALAPGQGLGGSTALAIGVHSGPSSIRRTDVARADEGYLHFWFNPNGVQLPEPTPNNWPPGTSLAVAEVLSSRDWWPPLVALYVRRPPGQGYRGYLAWPTDEAGSRHYDYQNAFELDDGWQEITIGYRVDQWVAVWLNGHLVRYEAARVVHPEPYGDVVYFGKIRESAPATEPRGTILFDNVAFQVPRLADLWVDAVNGNDENDGLSQRAAMRSIQRAADRAGPGTTVHILPGAYRETVWPALDGTAAEPVVYRAEHGRGTVSIRGSEPSSALAWTRMVTDAIGLPPTVDPARIWWTDLSAWGLNTAPRFVIYRSTTRLPLAREPDWQVRTEWRTAEFWWRADGGSQPAACDPVTDSDHYCDLPQRSMTQLTDVSDDAEPEGIEPGNLTTLGNLEGATLVAIDAFQGHYNYRRKVVAHYVPAGRVTVDRICEHDGGSGNPGLGWGTKYFVENKPQLLDTAGEWWYDTTSKRLYLWPPVDADPAQLDIEISRRDVGFSLKNRSHTMLDGLTIEMVNRRGVSQHNWTKERSFGNTLRNLLIRFANYGVYVEQNISRDEPESNVTRGFKLLDSEIAYIDSQGIRLMDWWDDGAAADSFVRSGISDTLIRGNHFHHLGFRTDGDNAIGLSFGFANKLRFEGNHVHHVGHNGVQFSKSVIQSAKDYGFEPSEIRTGEILVKDNLIEKACQLTTDCGPLKFWGARPDGHVFRDVLVTGNVFRDTYAWSYVSEKRRRYSGGEASQVRGMGAFGLYIDHASGIHAYRNVSYNNAYTGFLVYGNWRDGPVIYVNNVTANSLYGISLGGAQYDDHGNVDTRILNNIILNNEAFGALVSYAQGRTANLAIDHNLYFGNGWRPYDQGGVWRAGTMVVSEAGTWKAHETLADVQAATPWEGHGLATDPLLVSYAADDHDLYDGSWPDFRLREGSPAIDAGVEQLPPSLVELLDHFGIADYRNGPAYDIGRYEVGPPPAAGRLSLPLLWVP